MNLDINAVIFIVFLAGNFILGLWTSRGVNSLRGYAIGDKNFSTATLVATIVATWVSGSFFFSIISETYTRGISYIYIPIIGDFICLLMVGRFFIPRMGEFMGKLSIAEAMGDLYGNKVRFITAISGCIGVAGVVAVQLKIAGLMFEYALGIKPLYGILFSGTIITLYSSLGGINSVTLTDVVQFATFGIIIPIIGYFLFSGVDNTEIIASTLATHPSFDHSLLFSLSNPNIIYSISLFIWTLTPSFNPAYFQRIAMAKNTGQASHSFTISAFICLVLLISIIWIGVLVLSMHPNMAENEIFKFIINNSEWVNGFKGVILVGVMAMIMSTVDSYINSTSVLIIHDLGSVLNLSFIKNVLFSTRFGAMIIGLIAVLFAMRDGTVMELGVWARMFYMPVVTVPFMLAVIGFRSSSQSTLIGMGAGFIVAMTWEKFFKINGIGGLVPGMIANCIFHFGAHYLLKQPGGWIDIKNRASSTDTYIEQKPIYKKPISNIKSSRILAILEKNTPHGDGLIFFIGFFVMTSTFANTYSLTKNFQYGTLVSSIYITTLACASSLTSYPLWLPFWRQTRAGIAIAWNFIMFFCLICFGFLMVLISNFAEIQLTVFMVNIFIILSFTTWRWALAMIITGIITTTFCFRQYIYVGTDTLATSPFIIIHLLMMLSSTAVLLLRPNQEYIEEGNEEFERKINKLEKEIKYLQNQITDFGKKVIHYTSHANIRTQGIKQLEEEAQDILNHKEKAKKRP